MELIDDHIYISMLNEVNQFEDSTRIDIWLWLDMWNEFVVQ